MNPHQRQNVIDQIADTQRAASPRAHLSIEAARTAAQDLQFCDDADQRLAWLTARGHEEFAAAVRTELDLLRSIDAADAADTEASIATARLAADIAPVLIEKLAPKLAARISQQQRDNDETVDARWLAAQPVNVIRARLRHLSFTDHTRYQRTRQRLQGHVPATAFR